MGRDIGTGKVLTLVKSQPAQLSIFQTFFPEEDSDHYSNTIELYDALPKYFSNKQSMAALRQDGIFLKSLQRRCKHLYTQDIGARTTAFCVWEALIGKKGVLHAKRKNLSPTQSHGP